MNKESKSFEDRQHPLHLPNAESWNCPIIVFLSVCSAKRRKILANERVHHALLAAWGKAEHWNIGSYLIMPDHIHLFCSPARYDSENISMWTAYWKKLVSLDLPDLQPIWQRHCWDTQLRSYEGYEEKRHYVYQNPVRAGLVQHPDEWPFKGEINIFQW